MCYINFSFIARKCFVFLVKFADEIQIVSFVYGFCKLAKKEQLKKTVIGCNKICQTQ